MAWTTDLVAHIARRPEPAAAAASFRRGDGDVDFLGLLALEQKLRAEARLGLEEARVLAAQLLAQRAKTHDVADLPGAEIDLRRPRRLLALEDEVVLRALRELLERRLVVQRHAHGARVCLERAHRGDAERDCAVQVQRLADRGPGGGGHAIEDFLDAGNA
eukprot:2184797-Rhodomonas_salina.1